MEYEKITPGERWHKADVIHNNRVRLELFRRFGVLPGSGDHHVAEFFPGFVTPENDYGSQWKVHIYGLRKHMADADDDVTHYEAVRDSDEVSRFPSGELVAPLLEALITGTRRDLPVNLPNRGQVANLPDGVVVEAMGTVDGDGVRARDRVEVPSVLGEYLRRVVGVAGAHRRRRAHRRPHRGVRGDARRPDGRPPPLRRSRDHDRRDARRPPHPGCRSSDGALPRLTLSTASSCGNSVAL